MKALAYRQSDAGDLPFVYSSWGDSFRTSRCAGIGQMSRWKQRSHEDITDILARPGVAVWVAYHPGEVDRRSDLYGFVAVERDYIDSRKRLVLDIPLVHYVYVKAPYRLMGIARGLFAAADVGLQFNYSTSTSAVADLQRAGKMPGARWEHLAARFAKTT